MFKDNGLPGPDERKSDGEKEMIAGENDRRRERENERMREVAKERK